MSLPDNVYEPEQHSSDDMKQAYIDGSNSVNELVQSLHTRIDELEAENEKLKCPVNAMQCEYARIRVECAAPELDCPHRKPQEDK